MSEPLLGLELQSLLDSTAKESSAAASSTASAVAVALGAGMVAMAARRSPRWPEASACAGQAEVLRARAEERLQENVDAYENALTALQSAGTEGTSEQRDWSLGVAVTRAAAVPLALAEIGVDVTELAVAIAADCDADVRPDAVSGGIIAEAGVQIATHLVEVNLTVLPGDTRTEQCRRLRELAENAIRRITEPTEA